VPETRCICPPKGLRRGHALLHGKALQSSKQPPFLLLMSIILLVFCLMQSRFASSIHKLSRFAQTKRRTILNMAQPGTFESQMKDGWFTELSTMWPGQGMSLKIEEVIFRDRSDFQVRIFQMRRSQSYCTIFASICQLRSNPTLALSKL
jgi:hypothetical protein